MNILVTGFDPFGGEMINPSYEAVKKLPNEIGGNNIIKLLLPTEFINGIRVLEDAIKEYEPAIIISIGQAGGRSCITPEFVAVNCAKAKTPDNLGYLPKGEKVRLDGDNAYFTTLPIEKIKENLNNNGIPCHISNTAGTYVCNTIMYTSLYLAKNRYNFIKAAGFIHVPYIAEQAVHKPNGTPFMTLSMITDAIKLSIEATINENLVQ